ncbi:MAG: helix-turn-helix domain-containing protein [Lachnospiraceae bacterium]|nr:helix-turn-helix domain-containing protein [Lachnospiraceae bacterium]
MEIIILKLRSGFIKMLGTAKKLLNVNEVCDYLGIGQTKARELLRGHNGFGIQIGNRWYANKNKLDAWIDRESL